MPDLIREQNCVAIIGPATSDVTKEVSIYLSKSPEYNRAVIGYSATSAELSGPDFANFVRTPPTDNFAAQKMASLMAGPLVVRLAWAVLEGDFKGSG